MKTTTIEWYRPEEKMPKKGTTDVLVIYGNGNGHFTELSYSDEQELFNASNGGDCKHAFKVHYWAYVPTFNWEDKL